VSPYDVATSYNNFYEFGYGKSDPKEKSSQLQTRPWTITVEGEAGKTGVLIWTILLKNRYLRSASIVFAVWRLGLWLFLGLVFLWRRF